MNILPKKSWHVRNKDNVAKVRRDEAKAAEEEKERERRRALAEQEARTELLRARARQRLVGEGGKEATTSSTSIQDQSPDESSVTGTELVPATSLDHQGHINFFRDLEEGKKVGGVNKEHEEEKKKEQEQREKDIGLLTYLGQSAVEAQGSKPWYLNKTRRDDTQKEEDEQDKSAVSSMDMKRKNFLDPVHDMNRYLSKKRSKHQEEHKRHKKKHKEKHRDSQKGSEARSRQSSVSVEQLRAERLKREAEEKAKTERLLALRRGEAPKPTEAEVMETSKFRYNSQFNPDLVRKPRPRYQPY
ncbi:leukocyte receptor cluster member 1 homolog [Branchiostoma lanceolatum]|uniref:leukocyte receptor cluster member 1 homolog n=1 Tax=Branchiostoma lanceolatum TaxID=7740 RepID=UPI003453B911